MKKLIQIICALILSLSAFGQSVEPDEIDAPMAKEGTYEFVIVDSINIVPVALTDDLLKTIEANRHVTEFVLMPINNNISVRIFPEQLAKLEENE